MTEKLKTVQEVLNSLILHTKAEKKQFNKFGNYKYRSGEDILEAVKEELKKDKYPTNCTLISNPSLEVIGTRLFVKVTTTLEVGEEKREAVGYAEHGQNKKGMDEAQLTGSTSTYAKKYSLQNLFQLDETSEDIDSKDNTKAGEKAPVPKNAFGITQGTVDQATQDLAETAAKESRRKAEAYFAEVKKKLEDCGSVAEMDGIIEKESRKLNSLAQKHNDLFIRIQEAREFLKEQMGE